MTTPHSIESILRQFKQLSDDHELLPWLEEQLTTVAQEARAAENTLWYTALVHLDEATRVKILRTKEAIYDALTPQPDDNNKQI